MSESTGSNGCRVAAIVLAVLLGASVCMLSGLVVGGAAGVAAGYALGQARAARVLPRFDIPFPETPSPQLPEEFPDLELRPFLGVFYRTTDEGALITQVEPDSPAEAAGLREGDIILAVDDAPVGEGHPDLAARILSYEPGDEVELSVQRDGDGLNLIVTLGERLSFEGHHYLPPEMSPDQPGLPEG